MSTRIARALVAALGLAAVTTSLAQEPAAEAAPVSSRLVDWTTQHRSTAFNASAARLGHGMHLAGHPLDVEFDPNANVWTLGEFAMQVGRSSSTAADGTAMTKLNVPIKPYVSDTGQLLGWTKPFLGMDRTAPDPVTAPPVHGSASELGESVAVTPDSVWVSQGGQQHKDGTGNHSLLTRYPLSGSAAETCAVPLPGDQNEVIGLAYDAVRDRIWFAESQGDHITASMTPQTYSTLGWVKASGLGTRCQNDLDYGGDPRLTAAQNAAKRASAQQTINALACTDAQDAAGTGNCVHRATSDLPTGATHIAYDARGSGTADDVLWINNWYDLSLVRYDIATRTRTIIPGPDSSFVYPETAVGWQIEVDAKAVYVNEYEGNRITRYDKATGTWSSVRTTTDASLNTHSITRAGDWLWFTLADEDQNGTSKIGKVDLRTWTSTPGTVKATLYTGWDTLPFDPGVTAGARHSFRGIDVQNGKIAVADHGDFATWVLTPK